MGQAVETDSMLRKTLESLCCGYGWSYGVFWRFDKRNSMLLTLEDAYYEEQMGVAIDRMLLQVHVLGEGIIGQAAFTGRRQWISSDDRGTYWNSFCSIRSQDKYQDEDEFHHQFSSGIKTVAIISVESQGVVQFGSTKKILESVEFLEQAKRLFCQVEHTDFTSNFTESFTSTPGFPNISGDPLISHMLHPENQFLMTDTQAQVMLSKPNSRSHQSLLQASTPCISTWSTEASSLTSFEKQLPSTMSFQDPLDAYSAREDTFFSCGVTVENFQGDSIITSSQSTAPVVGKTNLCDPGRLIDNQSFSPSICATEGGFLEEPASMRTFQEDSVPNASSLFDNILQWLPLSPDQSMNEEDAMLNDDFTQIVSAGLDGGDVINDIQANSMQSSISNAFSFDEKERCLDVLSAENDLVDRLGLDIGSNLAGESWEDMTVPVVSGHSAICKGIPKCISELDVGSAAGPRKRLFSELGLEQLLENIVGKDNSVPNSSSEDQAFTSSRKRKWSSLVNCNQDELGSLSYTDGDIKPKQPVYMLDKLTNLGSQKEAVPKSQVGLWIDDSYSINARSTVTSQTKRQDNHKKTIKKRARPGESTRPRPKDRQLIQDRLKELKEIIPNSGKLSIDALLDRTIKHLLFLQSVTKYADGLKQDDEPKLIGQENGVVLRENFVGNGGGGGATWAFEVGGQTLVCPIIVEDLGPPGQMLIEMLCEEGGFFLEIADIIRGFSLTILKGVMEARDNKLWARFTVEANHNITRMDIFMSLIHLLQQTTSSVKNLTGDPSSVINGGIAPFDDYQQPLQSHPIKVADKHR